MYENLIKHMKALNYKDHWIKNTIEWINELQQGGVYCVDRFLQKLLKTKDKITCSDIITQGRFTTILAKNGFKEIHIEYCKKGPDMKAYYNRSEVYFEVTRKRSKVDEWGEPPENIELPSAKSEDIISKIQGKIGQLIYGKTNILVFWSDTLAVGTPEMKEAVEYMRQETDQNAGVYKKLSGILFFNGGGYSVPTMKQCDLFKNERALKPIGSRLARRLDCLNEKSPKQLKRERERWTVILKRNSRS